MSVFGSTNEAGKVDKCGQSTSWVGLEGLLLSHKWTKASKTAQDDLEGVRVAGWL